MQLPETSLSLRQMCFSKTALIVYNDPEVRHFVNTHDIHNCIWTSYKIESFLGKEPVTLLNNAQVQELLSNRVISNMSQEYKHRFTDDGKGHSLPNKQWEILLKQKLSSLSLPDIFKKEVTALVRLVLIESYKWFQDHRLIIKPDTSLQNRFRWTQDNKIDRQKTAKAIIHDNSIDIVHRFILASQYCFQEDVLSIWGILDDAQQDIFKGGDIWANSARYGEELANCYRFQDNGISVGAILNDTQKKFFLRRNLEPARMWANWARNGVELDLEKIAGFSRLGLQRYFPKLEQEKRLPHLLRYHHGIWINYHELQFCLSILNQNEQSEFFKKLPFQVIEVFLDWPVQEKLLDVVELLWPYLSEQNFCDLFDVILFQKHLFNWIGNDYITLVKKLYKRCSFEHWKFIEKDSIYSALKFALQYDTSHSFPRELREQRNDDNFLAFHSGTTAFVIFKYKGDFFRFMLPLRKTLSLYFRTNMRCFFQV
ncbi:uncharacterized protein TNCT_252411 [Trichonephila clavata]|uniref:Uncharacterized protein n=1 Tax=Trichonephila clavata TaxID=2740835 RepID=A0A8X6HB53_TRICU|nr:uncharacterized protein TNCT_252411 [Trichonephila clavata]